MFTHGLVFTKRKIFNKALTFMTCVATSNSTNSEKQLTVSNGDK